MRIFKLMLFVVLLFMPVLTWAKGQAGVAHGVHNLSSSGIDQYVGQYDDTPGSSLYRDKVETRICVFCHTPHGGSLTGALWNRNNPGSAWRHYNSATMSIDTGVSPLDRAPNEESLICLSCHDGSVAVNHVINLPNDLDGVPFETWNGDTEAYIVAGFSGTPDKRIGGSLTNNYDTGDLSDDHPISFSYDQVRGSEDYLSGFKVGTLKTVTAAENNGNGVLFFGAANNVECSSCHDPHVDYLTFPEYTPFLRMSNSGSALCLACHTK